MGVVSGSRKNLAGILPRSGEKVGARRLAQQIPTPSVRSENADRLPVVSRARRPQVFGRGQHGQAGLPIR